MVDVAFKFSVRDDLQFIINSFHSKSMQAGGHFSFYIIQRGRRNVFTTGLAKLDHEDYAIKCVGS